MNDTIQTGCAALGYIANDEVDCGTTLIAVEYDGGAVVGVDSRTSSGSMIVSRVTDKITPITKRMVALRSGSAADTQAITDIVKYYVALNEVRENEPFNVYRTAQVFRKFGYEYRDDLSASLIIAGYDDTNGGQVYAVPIGGYVTRQRCTASGSGSVFVQGFLDSQWKPNMSEAQCIAMVKAAVALAIHHDGSSGGVIRLAIVSKDGTKRELLRPDVNQFPQYPQRSGYRLIADNL